MLLAGEDVTVESYNGPTLEDGLEAIVYMMNSSEFKSFPRIFYWHEIHQPKQRYKMNDTMTTFETRDAAMNGTEPLYNDCEKDWFTKCQPIQDIPVWPTCNSLHELDPFLDGSSTGTSPVALISMKGSWRSVWIAQDPTSNEQIILKLLHIHRDFEQASDQAHQMDVRIMEQLTASPRVVSSFGFCGQSVLTQFALTSGSRAVKDRTLSWQERLIMARNIARGLAELHALQPIHYHRILDKDDPKSDAVSLFKSLSFDKPQVFAHHDINMANTVSLKPKQLQWNDFNLGVMSKHLSDGSGKCAIPIRYGGTLWRSPEEIENATGLLPTLHPADVYAFGTLLFAVLAKHQPWNHLESQDENRSRSEHEIAAKKLRGDLPNLPGKYQPRRKEAKILWAAARACFRRDPQQRPTAYQLALALGLALEYIQMQIDLPDDVIEKLFAI